MTDYNLDFQTRAIHGNYTETTSKNALRFPVYAGVAFNFDNAEDMEAAFNYRKAAHAYSRISNPTVEHFEKKLTLLEEGYGTIALSSGMAAITNTLLGVLRQGDNLIASKHLFGNTYSLLKESLTPFGIETRFVDITNPTEIEVAIDHNTRLIFFETITNPQMIVADCSMLHDIASRNNLLLIADGTVTTPLLFRAKKLGVHVIVHSTTKYISGGATSVGGAIVDLGTYNWQHCPALEDYHRYGSSAFLARLRMEVYRNFGSCMTPQSAALQTLGLETLALRVTASCNNSLAIAQYLESHKKVHQVHYPGLESSPWYTHAAKQFGGHFGGVLSFEMANKGEAFHFINTLKLIHRATNINDNKSLIIHPASTIFSDCTKDERKSMGISDSLIRLSVGIESIEDLLRDISQAFES